MILFVGSSGTIFLPVVGHFQCMAVAFHYNLKSQSIHTILCNLQLYYDQNMSSVVSEWLIYSKCSSVPKVGIMTNLTPIDRHFFPCENCLSVGGRVCREKRSSNSVNVLTYRLINCHLLCISMDCYELFAHPGRDVL